MGAPRAATFAWTVHAVVFAFVFALCFAALVLAPAAAAHAAAPTAGVIPEVSLDLERCPALPRGQVTRLLALELDARVLASGGAGPLATRGAIVCGSNGVALEVSDPLTGRFLSRPLAPPGRDGDAAARIVALALAELIFTSWMDLAQPQTGPLTASESPPADLRRAAMERAQKHAGVTAPASAAPAAPPPSVPLPATIDASPIAAPAPAGETPPPTEVSTSTAVEHMGSGAAASAYLLAVGTATGPFDGVGLGWGAGARGGWTSGAAFYRRASTSLSPGADVELTTTWAEAGSALGGVRVSTFSAAPRASLRLFLGAGRGAWLDFGAGVRAGMARLVGTPADLGSARGGTLTGIWSGAAAFLGLGLAVGPVVVAAGLEGGQVLRSVSGVVDGERAVAISGRWLSGSLALGWGR